MPFPKTLPELEAQGYIFAGKGGCSACAADIEWWNTPAGKRMPMDTIKRTNVPWDPPPAVTSHWATCPNAARFRKGK